MSTTIWDTVPAGYDFIGITRTGRGKAFKSKPKWLEAAGVWADFNGDPAIDIGLFQDAIPHDQAPPLMTRPKVPSAEKIVGKNSEVVVIDEKADVPEVTELPKPPPGMVSDLRAPRATHFPPEAPKQVPDNMEISTKVDLVNADERWKDGAAKLVPMPVVQDRTVFGAPKPHVPEAVQELRNNGGKLPLSTTVGEGIVEARHAAAEVPHHTDGGVCLHCINAANAVEELEPSDDKGVVTEVVTPKPGTGKLMDIINPPAKAEAQLVNPLAQFAETPSGLVTSTDPALVAIAEAFELLYALLPRAQYECLTAKVAQIRALATQVHR